MVVLVFIAVFIAGAYFFTSISKRNERYRRNANYNRRRRGHSRRRDRYDDDDDDYDDRDDDYYRRNRRSRQRRRDDDYEDELDYTGMFISFGFLVLIGLGVYYWYNQSSGTHELTKSKIVMTRDYPDSGSDQNNEQQHLSEDDYPANNNLQNEDYDEDVGSIEENIIEEYDEQDTSIEVPQEVVPGNFYAQVHAFGSLDKASAAKEDWIAKGHPAKVVYFKEGDGFYHVLIGGYPSKRAAKSFMGKAYEQIYELEEGQYYDLK